MRNQFLRIGSILGFMAVALGAFAAHGLRPHLSPQQMDTFETAVRYQFYHALAILLISMLGHFGKKRALRLAGWAFTAGVVLFSGSLYALSTRDLHHLSVNWLGPITPLGGLCFLMGWGGFFTQALFAMTVLPRTTTKQMYGRDARINVSTIDVYTSSDCSTSPFLRRLRHQTKANPPTNTYGVANI